MFRISVVLSLSIWLTFLLRGTSAVNVFESDQARLAYIADRYSFSDDRTSPSLVRPTFETDLDYVVDHTDSDTIRSYAMGVGLWPVLAMGFGVLILLPIFIVTVSCRCCCHKCCCSDPNRKPPYFISRSLPFAALCPIVTFALLFAAFNFVALVLLLGANVNVSNFVESLSNHALRLSADFRTKARELDADIVAVSDSIDTAYDNITALVNDTGDAILMGLNDVSDKIDVQSNALQTVQIRGYSCQFCFALGVQLDLASQAVQELANPVITELETIRSEIADSFVEARANIDEAMTEARDRLSDATNRSLEIDEDIRDYRDEYVDHYEEIRLAVLSSVFAVVLLLVLFSYGVVYWFNGKHSSFFSYFFLFFAGLILLLVGVHTLLYVLLGDVCDMADKREQKLDTLFPDSDSTDLTDPSRTPARAAMTCLCDENVVKTFNYTEELSFRDRIKFPDVAQESPDDYLNFQEVNQFLDLIDQLNQSSFNYSAATTSAALVSVNNITSPDVFGLSNITGLNTTKYGGSYTATLTTLKTLLLEARLVELEIAWFLSNSSYNNSLTRIQINETVASVSQAQSTLLSANTTLEPVFDAVDELISHATCGFIGDFYYRIKRTTCVSLASNSGMIAFYSFVVTLYLLASGFVYFYIDTAGMSGYTQVK